MSENVSRRKMLSLLGFGGDTGLHRFRGVLEPLVAEAQEAAPATPPIPNPTAPATGSAEATGTHGMQRRQGRRSHRSERPPIAAMSDDTRAAPVNLLRPAAAPAPTQQRPAPGSIEREVRGRDKKDEGKPVLSRP